jgi:hypothetical protein
LIGFALVAFTSVGLGIANAQQSAPVQNKDNGPSLEETNEWIKDKLLRFAKFSETYPAATPSNLFPPRVVAASIENAELNGCRWDVRTARIGKRLDGTVLWEAHYQTTMQLQDLDTQVATSGPIPMCSNPQAVPTSGDKECFGIEASTEGKKKRVGNHLRSVDNNFPSQAAENTVDSTSSAFTIDFFTDRDMAERVANAMAHAIKLCKAKPEPF